MELSVREWMMIVGVLLIVAVFLDGYRRVRNERRNRIRVSLSKQVFQRLRNDDDDADDGDDPEERSRAHTVNFELPNGGARVIGRRQRDDDLQLHESVPLLMESVKVGPAEVAAPEPAPQQEEPEFEAELEEFYSEPLYAAEPEPAPIPVPASAPAATPAPAPSVSVAPPVAVTPPAPVAAPVAAPVFAAPAAPVCEPPRPAVAAPPPREPQRERSQPAAAPVNAQPQEVLVINVLSKDEGGFRGPDLLQIMLACDLRFGKMNIFHRYEKANGRGQVQFSVANLVEPGIFNLDAIDGIRTPGVSFFLALPGPEEPIRAFDYMVETAQVLVKNLHAELRDEAHSVMTAQTLEHCRQRIRDFERKQLTLHV